MKLIGGDPWVDQYVRALPVDVLLARLMQAEARGESIDGIIGVGMVVRNRVRAGGWYGSDYHSVIFKEKQFSALWETCTGNIMEMLRFSSGYTGKSRRTAEQGKINLARRIIAGFVPDITLGATHYHADYVTPCWARAETMVCTTKLGRHIFYRERFA